MKTPGPNFLAKLAILAVLLVAATQWSAAATRQPLWKIEGKGTVYLLGSVHVLKKEHYPLAAPLEAAFDKSKIAVFEADPDALQKPEFAMKLMTQSALPAGQTLRDQLSPKLYQQLAA